MKYWLIIILILTIIISCCACVANNPGSSPSTNSQASTQTDPANRYEVDASRNEAIVNDAGMITQANEGNARVYYQIFVGSFSDSNGDGIGDLRGIINRFDYLNDGEPNSGLSLGIEGIWLSPIFTSPSYHKYDANSYQEIDPKFGTMEDLKELIDLCHARGVQIILDLVINHTSRYHPWYKSFMSAHANGDTENEYYDYYTWCTERTPGISWHPINGTNQYYEGNFTWEMPELNYDNEAVRQAMVNVAKLYLDMGVDGFRFDAAKYIYYGNEPRNAEFWDWYMAKLRAIKPDIYTVAEVWSGDTATFPYFSSTNCFNFSMSQNAGKIAETAKGGNVNTFVNYLAYYMENIKAENPDAIPITFITNHDMDRAAGFLTTAAGHAQMAANLSILTPGSPFIYYGEEIGMLGSRGGSNTDANRRLAMLWGDSDTVKNPAGSNYSAKQSNGTVADQLPKSNSLYNHYKKLIMIRKANPEIAYGTFTALKTTTKVGGFVSTYNGHSVAVIHNTTTKEVTIDLSTITDISFTMLAAYVGNGNATLDGTVLTIAPQTSVVLR